MRDEAALSDIPVFTTSIGENSIEPKAHIDMCAAVQPFVSGGVSKTVNVCSCATVEEIEKLYRYAYDSGMKCVAMYRDGSKVSQPLEKSTSKIKPAQKNGTCINGRLKLPDTCSAKRHKFSIEGSNGFLHYTQYPDSNKLGEIFLTMSREGSTLGGLLDCFATAISIGLQYGVPLEVFLEKFVNTRFVPAGHTGNKEIPRTSSIVDYVFKYLAKEFKLNGFSEAHDDSFPEPPKQKKVTLDGPPCYECGSLTNMSGTCFLCQNCGTTTGCG